MNKILYITLTLVLSLLLVSCEANPTFEDIAYDLYIPNAIYDNQSNTYTLSILDLPTDPIEINYFLYCNSGGMFVEGDYYFQARVDHLFTYEISKDDIIIASKPFDETAPFEQVLFPKQGSNAPKAAIYAEEPLMIELDGAGTYKITLNAHTFYNQVWHTFSVDIAIIVTE